MVMVRSSGEAALLAAFTLRRSRNPMLDTSDEDFLVSNDAITARRSRRGGDLEHAHVDQIQTDVSLVVRVAADVVRHRLRCRQGCDTIAGDDLCGIEPRRSRSSTSMALRNR
jgi:hypothetical protein